MIYYSNWLYYSLELKANPSLAAVHDGARRDGGPSSCVVCVRRRVQGCVQGDGHASVYTDRWVEHPIQVVKRYRPL